MLALQKLTGAADEPRDDVRFKEDYMPRFLHAFVDTQITNQVSHKKQVSIMQKAAQLIAGCDTTEIKGESNINFVKKISNYLDERKREFHFFSDNSAQIEDRTNFIRLLIPLIKNNDIASQIYTLKDENIRRFKGFVSQRLYDILAARRTELEQEMASENTYHASRKRI